MLLSKFIKMTELKEKYDNEMSKGHSEQWSKLYANNIEKHQHAFNQTYKTIYETSPEQAFKELEIHCKAMGADELYTKHFISLMALDPLSNPDKQAAIYSKTYKEQIEKGKSEIFAHHYSDLMGTESDSEIYCFAEATEYEKAIGSSFSEKYAEAFAMQIAEYIANHYSNYNEAINDVLYKMEKQKIEKELIHLK